jgi:1,4-dihydroxy-2-naphthoyl-CoA hydrolase
MAGTSAEELIAMFGDLYDTDFAASLVSESREAMPGIPEFLGLVITELGPGWLTCELEVRPDLLNPVGVAHGAVVASLIDHVLGATIMPLLPPGSWPATLEFKVNYTAPAREGVLRARGEVCSMSKRTGVVEVECTNNGRTVAVALGTIAITPPKET